MKLRLLSFLLFFSIGSMIIVSCGKDEFEVETGAELGTADYGALNALIAEVEAYLATAEEGVNAGNHPPGSIAAFMPNLDNAKLVPSRGLNQVYTDRAVASLQTAFDDFRGNVVGPANPWIQQTNSSYILINDIKPLMQNNFTAEIKVWPITLQQVGFSNVIFGNAMGAGGENDRGFVVRYFADGHLEFIVGGTAAGWKQGSTSAGVLTAGQWNHVSLVISNDSGHRLYVDGTEVATLTGADEIYVNSDPEFPFIIGTAFPWQERVMNSLVRDFRFWTTARSADDIANNVDAELDGSESSLEAYFPLDANLGREFSDATGNYQAIFNNEVVWVADGNVGSVMVDFTALNDAIRAAQNLLAEESFGDNEGDIPSDASDYIQRLIDDGNLVLADASITQGGANDAAQAILDALALIQSNTVADAEGIKVDAQNDAVGLRVTPTYSPSGSFTIELEVNIESFLSSCCGQGNIFGNGSYGLIYGAYDDPDNLDQVATAGSLYFYIRNGGGYDGARAPAASIKQGWHHVALIYDADNLASYIVVDGVTVGEFIGREVPDPVDWSEMWIGNTWVKMDGSVRDFRFWNEVRSITDLDADITGTESSLEMYFPLNRVKGVSFQDEADGRSYNGTFRGGVEWNR